MLMLHICYKGCLKAPGQQTDQEGEKEGRREEEWEGGVDMQIE